MVIDEKLLAKIIGSSVGTYPNDVLDMLINNNILLPFDNYTTEELVDSVLLGLSKNEPFLIEYSYWLQSIIDTLNY